MRKGLACQTPTDKESETTLTRAMMDKRGTITGALLLADMVLLYGLGINSHL